MKGQRQFGKTRRIYGDKQQLAILKLELTTVGVGIPMMLQAER